MRHRFGEGLSLAIAIVLLGVGCSADSGPAPSPPGPMADAPQVVAVGAVERVPVATMVTIPNGPQEDVGDPPVAADVAETLKRLGRPIGEIETVSPTEARFVDTRLAGTGAKAELRTGGIVEVQPRAAVVPTRPMFLQLASLILPLQSEPEHPLTQGRILLRLSGRLTDSAMGGYAASLHRIRG
jgi:hypothetical protein